MPTFSYKAKTQQGEIRSGVIDASSQDAAIDILHQQNLLVISVEEDKGGESAWNISVFGGRVKQKDVVIFSRQLATLFEASIPVATALKTLVGETPTPALKTAIATILDDVSGGLALSQAFAKHPTIFSPFYIYLVRSGEESGKLQEVFTYLADYLERSYYLTSKARNAMIYPAFVLSAFVVVLIVMLVVIIPRLIKIFEETNQEVPAFTKFIIGLSSFLQHWGVLLLLLLIAGAILVWRWGVTESGKYALHTLQLRAPVFGDLYKKLYMARFTDNLRTLIVGGIPILRALEVTRDVVGNAVYQRVITEAIESVKGGSTISSALEKSKHVPVLVTQMIRIGEASGRLDFILGSIAKFYQREVDSAVDNLVALIEPILIIGLGLGVAALVSAVLVPLYNLVGSI